MAGQKRAKDVARAKQERQASRRIEQQRARRRNAIIAVGVVVAIAGIVLFALLRPDSEPAAQPGSAGAKPSPPVAAPAGISCTDAEPGEATGTYSKPEAVGLKPGSAMTLDTNCGPVTFSLDVTQAPKSTNALAFLAEQGWYNNGNCQRLVVNGIYVVQCGAGAPDGTGDPGFTVPDENLPKPAAGGPTGYARGTVAMANRGPNTSSSQFFVVYKDSFLAPDYTIVGQVTSGLEVIEYVAAQGVSSESSNLNDGPPAQPLVIKTATVRNGP